MTDSDSSNEFATLIHRHSTLPTGSDAQSATLCKWGCHTHYHWALITKFDHLECPWSWEMNMAGTLMERIDEDRDIAITGIP